MNTTDWINTLLALFTALMAGATLYQAIVTRRLACETAEGLKQADRHHQENLRPFCMIDFSKADQVSPFGSAFEPRNLSGPLLAKPDPTVPTATIIINGKLHNKGQGTAKEVFVYLNTRLGEGDDGTLRLTRPVFVSGLIGAEETIAIDVPITDRDVINTWDGTAWHAVQSFHAVAGQTYEIVLEYKDVFGNIFRTVHARGIWTDPVPNVGDPGVRAEMAIRPNKPAPAFLSGKQATRTQADLPSPNRQTSINELSDSQR
jgi:hypothetical protein